MTPVALPPHDCAVQAQPCAAETQAPLLLAKRSGKTGLRQLPGQIKIRYQLSWNGLPANGEMHWKRDGRHYQVELKLATVIGPVLRYQSEGRIGKSGLAPEQYRAWRSGQAKEAAEFDWPANTLKYGDGEPKETALEPGAQDFLSMDWQLALTGGKHLATPLQVTNGKKVYHYAIAKSGEGQEAGLTVNKFHASQNGDATEFSLAPEFHNVPVKISYKDEQKNVEMTATQIEVDGKTVWPKQ